MQKLDTIIFDLDGTLLDTLDDLADSVNYAMELYHFPLRTTSEVRSFVGNGVGRLIELAIPGGKQNADYDKCLAEFRRHYAENMQNKTRPYDGIMELLQTLSEKGCLMAIVSNKFDAAVKGLCRTFFGNYVKIAIGESGGVSKKPAPDTVFEALRQLGSSPDRAVYVGDSDVDADTANNAGIPFVGVTWGFRDQDILEQKGARHIIHHPNALLDVLFKPT